jgi:two-component system NtrC family sensor kinase
LEDLGALVISNSNTCSTLLFFNNLSSIQARDSNILMAYKLLQSRMNLVRRDESALANVFPVPFKSVAVALLSILLVAVGVLNLRDRAIWTDPTDGVSWIEAEGGLRADVIESGGPGSRTGIQLGDRLLSINGQAISTLGQFSDTIYQIKPGSEVTYVLSDGRVTRTVTLQLGSRVLLTARDALSAILAFLYLGIGVFVLFRGDRLPRTMHFYAMCLASFVLWFFSYTPKLGVLDWWVYTIDALAFLILPALFLHFCLRFPVDLPAGSRRACFLYLPAAILGSLHFLWLMGRLASLGLPRTAHASDVIDRIELVYFCAWFVIGGALLLKRQIRAREVIARQQLKWVSYGTLAGVVPFSLIYAIPVVLGARATFAMDSSILFLGLIPLSMGYALIHYRLMDVDAIARRSAAYFIASSVLLALYLLFVLVLGRALQWVVPQADFMAICAAVLVIALLFAPLRNKVQAWLDRLCYKEKFEERKTLLDFAHALSSEISLIPLSRSIVERISKTFQIDNTAIFLSDHLHKGFLYTAYARNPTLTSPLLREDEMIAESISGRPVPYGGTSGLLNASSTLVKEGFYYLQDLRHQGRRVGVIALGQLPSGRNFSTEDLDLLSALAGYAAMALENANLYSSVQRKALELEQLKAYTENILESINVAVLALDSDGRITSCNRAFEELYKTTRKQMNHSLIDDLFPADVITSIQRATGTKSWNLETPANIFKMFIEDRLGKRLIVNLSLIPLQGSPSMESGSLIVMEDITEKTQLEGQLMQAEKLSSIGLLAAGIAHEVNTPIAGISSYTQMLLKETPETDRRKHILEKIEKQTFRAAEIVNSLLNFSRLNGGEFGELDINHLIDESLALLNHQMRANHIYVESQYDRSLPPVYGNSGKLQQVFINLFLNARDAMPAGGKIEVQTAMTDSMVIVDVSDTGTGISEKDIKRIFDPFFTTKEIGKGTGLGLAVSYGIIQEHGGRIFVDSHCGKGTHFRVKLPTRLN